MNVLCYLQVTYIGALCWVVPIVLRVVRHGLWEDKILHLPLPSIHCLLYSSIWIYRHICPCFLETLRHRFCPLE